MWVLDFLEDLESDFSVFHRVEDITILDGPRFFRLAHRIFAYSGVMTARFAEQEHKQSPQPQQIGTSFSSGVVHVPIEQLQMDGIVERRSASVSGI